MSPGILGKKIGMTQMFREDGQAVPVTLLKAGPCMVVQRKTPTSDGYDAVQLGLVENIKEQRLTKPAAGHLKKAGVGGSKFLTQIIARTTLLAAKTSRRWRTWLYVRCTRLWTARSPT